VTKKKKFINELRYKLDSMEMANITNYKELEHTTQEFASIVEDF